MTSPKFYSARAWIFVIKKSVLLFFDDTFSSFSSLFLDTLVVFVNSLNANGESNLFFYSEICQIREIENVLLEPLPA